MVDRMLLDALCRPEPHDFHSANYEEVSKGLSCGRMQQHNSPFGTINPTLTLNNLPPHYHFLPEVLKTVGYSRLFGGSWELVRTRKGTLKGTPITKSHDPLRYPVSY